MDNLVPRQKLSLRKALEHSILIEVLDLGAFRLRIRPWAPAQLEELQPLVLKIFAEFKQFQKEAKEAEAAEKARKVKEKKETDEPEKTEDIKETDEIPGFDPLDYIAKIVEKKEYFDDILHLVYVTIERGNETILVTTEEEVEGEEGKEIKKVTEEYGMFDEKDMREQLEIPVIVDILKIVWKQNVAKNLSRGSKPVKSTKKNVIDITEKIERSKDEQEAMERAKDLLQSQ